MAIENIYLFTEDNEKVCIGRYDTTPLVEVPLLRNWDHGYSVFYDIPEGTEVYLDNAGTQQVIACSTVIDNSSYSSVWVRGNGVLGYIYMRMYAGCAEIDFDSFSENNDIQQITCSFLSERYTDGSLSLLVSSGIPVLSGDYSGLHYSGLDSSTGEIVTLSNNAGCSTVLNNHICVDSIGKVPVSIARNSDDGGNTIFVDYSDSSRSIRDSSLVSSFQYGGLTTIYYKENGVGMSYDISPFAGGGSND